MTKVNLVDFMRESSHAGISYKAVSYNRYTDSLALLGVRLNQSHST